MEFLKNKNSKNILFPYYFCCELRVICLENENPWWNMILWTSSLPSTWPKVYSKILLHKVTILMFSQELIWRGEIKCTNVLVSGLILKMRRYASWEMMYFIAFSFGYTSYQSRPRGSRAFRLSSRTIVEDSKKWLSSYADWLRSILYCYLLTYFRITNSLPIVTLAHAQ